MSEECGRPAEVQFAWGGEIVKMCRAHAQGPVVVGQAIGMAVMLAEYQGDAVCTSHDLLPEEDDGKD